MIKRLAMLAMLTLVTFALVGCGGYRLQGRVVEGPVSAIAVVDRHDPRLEQPGMPGVSIQAVIDPQHLNRKRLPAQNSGAGGDFAIPVGEFGAGLLEYEVEVVARASGYESAVGRFPLPSGDKRLLIMVTPGRDTFQPGTRDLIDETIRLGEPYLRD
jgi:hypothetical protein